MNLDDLLCVGVVDNILLSSTIGQNKNLVPGDVIAAVINGTEEMVRELKEQGVGIVPTDGETADVGTSCAPSSWIRRSPHASHGRTSSTIATLLRVMSWWVSRPAARPLMRSATIAASGATGSRRPAMTSSRRRWPRNSRSRSTRPCPRTWCIAAASSWRTVCRQTVARACPHGRWSCLQPGLRSDCAAHLGRVPQGPDPQHGALSGGAQTQVLHFLGE